MSERLIQSNEVLESERLRLRAITIADAKDIFKMLSEQETMRLTGTQQTFVFEQVEVYCARMAVAPDRADFVITLKEPATSHDSVEAPKYTFIGEAILNRIDFQGRMAHYRIALLQEYVNQHYGTEATELVLAYAFDTLRLHRVELEVYDFNPRALHVYERMGFVHEGRLRDAHYQEGAFHDAVIMSMLEEEWRQRSH